MSTLRTRIVAFLLAFSMLAGYALPTAAEEVQPGVEIAAEVEPTAAPDPEPQPEPAQEPAPEPQPEPAGETPTEAPTVAPTEAPTEPSTVTTEPENTEPETTEPQETQAPETTEPEETEQEVTEPEETEPELAYPDATIYYAAPVEEHLVYGMNIVYPGTYDGCWDFPINSVTAVRYGGTLYATMHVGVAAAYRYLYFGSKAELEARLAQGGPFPVADAVRNNGELLFHFTTGAADNSRLTLCLVAVDGSQALGYRVEERELTVPTVPEEAIALFAAPHVTTSEITAGSYAAAPEGTQEQEAPGLLVAKEGEAYSEFKVTSATALAVDETIYITLRVAPQEDKTYAYSYLYLDDEDSLVDLMENDADITAVQGVENNEDQENPVQVYHFTLSADKLKDTRRVPVCLLKGDLTEDDAYVALELIVPDQLPTPAPAPADDVPEQEDEPEEQDQENQGEQKQKDQENQEEQEPEEQEQEEPKVIAVAKAAQYGAAPVAEKDITGLSVVDGEGAALNGFTVASATGINANGQLYLTLQVTPAAENPYIYLFLGDKTALDAKLATEGEFSVVGCDTVEGTQSYHFTLSAAQAVSPVSVCLLKSDLSYTEAKLTLPEGIPTWTIPTPTAKKYADSPFTEQEMLSEEIYVAKKGESTPYADFVVADATAAINGADIYVTLYVASQSESKHEYNYTYLYFGSNEDLENTLAEGGKFDVVKGANKTYNKTKRQGYHFTLSLTDLGALPTRIPVCVLKSSLTAENPYNTEELELVLPSSFPEQSIPTADSYPAAPAKEQTVDDMYVPDARGEVDKDTGKVKHYSVFNVVSATAVKDSKNIYVTLDVSPKSNANGYTTDFNYGYLYFGNLASLKKQLRVGGKFGAVKGLEVAAETYGVVRRYHFTLPLGAEGTNVPVCVIKSEADVGHNSSELVLIVPDGIPEVPVPTAKKYADSPFTEQEMLSEEIYVAKKGESTPYADFVVADATAAINGADIYVTLYVASQSESKHEYNYTYLYFGSNEDLENTLAEGGKFDVVKGANKTYNKTKRQGYHFTLSLTDLGALPTRIPVCVLKSSLTAENPYNTEELELVLPSSFPEQSIPTADSYPAAPAKEQTVDDMYVPDARGEVDKDTGKVKHYSVFNVVSATAVKDSKNIYVTLDVSPKSNANGYTTDFNYGYLYFGNLASLKKQLRVGGEFGAVKGLEIADETYGVVRRYHFTLPLNAEGTDVPVCVIKSEADVGHNSSELVLIVPNGIPKVPVPTPVYVSSPAEEGELSGVSVVVQETNEAYSDFTIASATGLKANGKLYITALVNPDGGGKFAYDYLYFGTMTELEEQLAKGGTFDVIGGVVNGEKQNYHFVLTADQAGSSIPVCLVKKDLTYNEVELVLTVPEDISAGAAIPAPAIPALPDTLSETGIKVIKVEDNAEFKMFKAAKTGMVIAGDKLLVHFETASKSYDRLYFGVKEDDLKSPYVQGTARANGGWVFEFELPASYRGTKNPICLGQPDGTWYSNQNLLISIPADTGNVAEVLENADIQICPAGQFSQTGFAVSSSSAILLGDNVYITITGKMTGRNAGKVADKLYLGSRSDRTKEPYVTGTVNSDGTTTFSFPVSADKMGTSILVVAGFNDGTWDASNVDYFLNVPSFGKEFDISYYTDGVYNLYGNAYLYQDKVARRSQPIDGGSTLTVSGDQVTIKWITRSTDADKLYIGLLTDDLATREAGAIASVPCEESDRTDYRVFTITMPKSMLSNQIPIVRHSTKWYQDTNGWLEKGGQDYLVLGSYLPRISTTPVDPVDPTNPTDPTTPTDPTEPSGKIEDGYYQVTTECDALMFRIIDAKLKVVNGKMTAELTLSGTGYDYLYAGTKEQAAKDKANWAPFTKNAEGKYVYTVPVSALDEPLNFASHSIKNDEWYDRVVTFLSTGLKKIGDVDPTDPTDPTTPTDPTDPTNPTDPTTPTSPSEPDTNGSTSAVNSSTTLKDGEYKPDGFTFSGGTGKTKIVCDKVVVKGGKSFAVIHFESTTGTPSAYKYVKASGNVYYPTADGKFTIPVTLNANNRILGMTTKMSAAHEIEYTIYIQLKKAQSTTSTGGGGSLSTEEEEKDDPDSKLDKTAPEILGLEFKENIKTSGARYLKLFQYDQGVVLAEVDLRRDTVLDTDEAIQALAQADREAKEASQSQTVQSDEPADTAQITSDYVAAQYQGDILKYLLVPAGVDLPAGLEKDYLIVSIPASNVYLMDETLADTLDQLGALKNVSVLPEDCENAELYDMLETGEKLPGGTWEKPDYRTIIKEKVALGLIGTEPLPLSEKALTERKETVPEREELTAVEYRDRLTKLTDRFAVLDIPLVVDRSADEPEAKGQAAWLKLYGILFGKQDAANKLYDAAIAKEDKA